MKIRIILMQNLVSVSWEAQSFTFKADDDRIVSHDAILYLHDATSKLSWIQREKNVVFSAVDFLFLSQ